MNNLSMQITEQIVECKKLMGLFQDEREKIINNNQIKKEEIIDYLKRKSILAEEISKKVSFFATIADVKINEDIDAKKKIRDLSANLEQLLVIDTENERLVKEFFAKSNVDKKSLPAKKLQQKKYSLNAALPLMPKFNTSMENSVKPLKNKIEDKVNIAKPIIEAKETVKKTVPARNKLKNYGTKGRFLNSFA